MPRVLVSEATRAYAHNLDDLRERWSIRKEAATETEWMPTVVFYAACQLMDFKDLQQLRAGLVEIQHSIIERIRDIEWDRRMNGHYVRPDEWNEIHFARQSVGRHLVIANEVIGHTHHRDNQIRAEAFAQRFVDIARARLDKTVFDEICRQALEVPHDD